MLSLCITIGGIWTQGKHIKICQLFSVLSVSLTLCLILLEEKVLGTSGASLWPSEPGEVLSRTKSPLQISPFSEILSLFQPLTQNLTLHYFLMVGIISSIIFQFLEVEIFLYLFLWPRSKLCIESTYVCCSVYLLALIGWQTGIKYSWEQAVSFYILIILRENLLVYTKLKGQCSR